MFRENIVTVRSLFLFVLAATIALIALAFSQPRDDMEGPISKIDDQRTGCTYIFYGSVRGLEVFPSRVDCGVNVNHGSRT